jgi:hypothetical protein
MAYSALYPGALRRGMGASTVWKDNACSCGENPTGSPGAEVGAKPEKRRTTGDITIAACQIKLADATPIGDKLGFKLEVL